MSVGVLEYYKLVVYYKLSDLHASHKYTDDGNFFLLLKYNTAVRRIAAGCLVPNSLSLQCGMFE